MKQTIKIITLSIVVASVFASCQKSTLELYNTSADIYFSANVYGELAGFGGMTHDLRFSYTEAEYMWLSIPIRILGDLVNYDREVRVIAHPFGYIDPEGNFNYSIEGVHWDSVYALVPAGKRDGTVWFRALKVHDEVGQRQVMVQLELASNEHFGTKFHRHMYNQTNRYYRTTLHQHVFISNVIGAPFWWRSGHGSYVFVRSELGLYSPEKYRLLRMLTGYPAAYFDRVVIGQTEEGEDIIFSWDGKSMDMDQIPGFSTELRYYLYDQAIVKENRVPWSCRDVRGFQELCGANWSYVQWDMTL
jgi:hypothetical protein